MTTLCPYNGYCQNKTDMGYCGITGGCSKRFPSRVIYTFNVDAVEVVRCKDCKHYQAQDLTRPTTCAVGLEDNLADDFCSRGERREHE